MNCPHCATAVDEHEANRCLSAWVYVDVMERELPNHDWEIDTYCDCLPDYSTSIAAAFQVALKVVGLKSIPVSEDAPLWICRRALRAAL